MGKMDRALDAVTTCWGGQIDIGATTFWEVYSPQWNAFISRNDPVPNGQNSFTSLCHPWAGIYTFICYLVVFKIRFISFQRELHTGCRKMSLE